MSPDPLFLYFLLCSCCGNEHVVHFRILCICTYRDYDNVLGGRSKARTDRKRKRAPSKPKTTPAKKPSKRQTQAEEYHVGGVCPDNATSGKAAQVRKKKVAVQLEVPVPTPDATSGQSLPSVDDLEYYIHPSGSSLMSLGV